jgi:hypothetical protein
VTIDQFPGRQASQAMEYLVDYIENGTEPDQDVYSIKPEPVSSP